MKFNDAIIGLVVALFGAVVISQAWYFPKAQHIPYGPGFLPTILGIGLILCGALLVIGGIAQRREQALLDRKSTRLNSSHTDISRMPSSA